MIPPFSALHLFAHLLLPGLVARALYRERWVAIWGVMLLGWLIDVDHLLADPIYDPSRCSIGFHPLHTLPAAGMYLLLLLPRRSRPLAIGLLLHLLLDSADCALM